MDERLVQFRVGVMVLATFIITGVLILLFGEVPSLVQGTYPVTMRFPKAPGVTVDTPVRKSGILIGRVTEVSFDPQGRGVIVVAQINTDRPVFTHEVPRVSGNILGDATIEFVPGRQLPKQRELVEPGALLTGEVAPNPLEAITELQTQLNEVFGRLEQTALTVEDTSMAIRESAVSFTRTSDQWTQVGQRVVTLLEGDTEEEAKGLIRKAEQTLNSIDSAAKKIGSSAESFDKTVTDVRKVVNDPEIQAGVRKTLDEFPKALEDARTFMADVKAGLGQFQKELQTNLQEVRKDLKGTLTNVQENLQTTLTQAGKDLKVALTDLEDNLSKEVNTLQKNVSTEVKSVSQEAQTAIKDVRGDVKSLVTTTQTEVKEVSTSAKAGIEEARAVLKTGDKALQRIEGAASSAETNLRNLEGLTKPIGEKGEQIVQRVDTAITRLDYVIAQVGGLVKAVGESEGTIGQLLRNPELYQNLNKVAEQLVTLSRHLQPILDDVRVISDKLARDPSNILRGAIRRQPSIIK